VAKSPSDGVLWFDPARSQTALKLRKHTRIPRAVESRRALLARPDLESDFLDDGVRGDEGIGVEHVYFWRYLRGRTR